MFNKFSRHFLILSIIALSLFQISGGAVVAVDDDDHKDDIPRSNEPTPDRRVMIISIDGLRPDLALLADMPNLRSLMKTGSYSMWAQTLPVGITLPSHTSMMTGVQMERHGIFWNDDTPIRKRKYEYPHVPTLFEWAKTKGYSTALVAGKYKFVALARPGSVDQLVLPEQPKRFDDKGKVLPAAKVGDDGLTDYDRKYSNEWVGEEAAKVIDDHRPQVMMVHFPRVDSAGHSKGWGSPEQMAAIESADKALGLVLDALKEAKVYDQTLIILSADHGGFGKVHNGKDPRGLHIPWIAHGPGIRSGYDLNQHSTISINTLDTFATAAAFLEIKFSADDEIEGRVVVQAFDPKKLPAPPKP
jgi:predicted AlkP superfamily pyrophosphatase or phosphodiesterase